MPAPRRINNPLSDSSNSSSNNATKKLRHYYLVMILTTVIVIGYTALAVAFFSLPSSSTLTSSKQNEQAQNTDINVKSAATPQNNLRNTSEKNDSNNNALQPHQDSNNNVNQEEVLLLTLHDVGILRINLRPNYSKESVDYIHRILASGQCERCTFYRAEKPGILQGIIKNKDIPLAARKGSCPIEEGAASVKNDCPDWDKNCACHGPVMKRGMVAWAAGDTGPDFFIDAYLKPATWWGTQHTVWGEITDEASLNVIKSIWELPVDGGKEMTYLINPIKFSMSLEKANLEMMTI